MTHSESDLIAHYRPLIDAYLAHHRGDPPGLVKDAEGSRLYALPPNLVRPNVWPGAACKCGCYGPNAWEILVVPKDGTRWFVVHDDAWYLSSSLPAFVAGGAA